MNYIEPKSIYLCLRKEDGEMPSPYYYIMEKNANKNWITIKSPVFLYFKTMLPPEDCLHIKSNQLNYGELEILLFWQKCNSEPVNFLIQVNTQQGKIEMTVCKISFMKFSRQEHGSGLPFSSPVDQYPKSVNKIMQF